MMKNILVLAYQISPTRGSEYSVAWNYVTRMSRYHHLLVVYGTSGNHMGDTEEMEAYLQEHTIPNVEFVCVKPSRWTDSLNFLNRHGILQYTFYLAYHSWQKQVYKAVNDILQHRKVDLIHFVGPIGYREPGLLWKFDVPYLWGPIGGANYSNEILQSHLPFSAKLKFRIRNWMNYIQLHHNHQLKKALSHTDLLLCATTENQHTFKAQFGKENLYIPENSIPEIFGLNQEKFDTEIYHFVVLGALNPGKAVNVLLEALQQVRQKDKLVIDIVGDGPMRGSWTHYAEVHGLSGHIVWHGALPRQKAVEIFTQAHMLVITSVSEGNPTTVWEAMAHGVPILSFDHCGMHDTVTEKTGIKIPIVSYGQCLSDLAKTIDHLLENPVLFRQLAESTISEAQNHTWAKREQFLLNCYDQAISNFDKK